MATVRFSGELKDTIRRNAVTLMQPGIERAASARPADSWGDRLYNIIFSKDLATLSQLAPHWTRRVSTLYIGRMAIGDCDVAVQVEFLLSAERGVPKDPWKDEYVTDVPGLGYGNPRFALADHPDFAEFRQEVLAWRVLVDEAQERADAFVKNVMSVVDAHVTLAPALKAWPPLWDLLPETTKDKHREVQTRAEKRDAPLAIDLDKLTAMSTAAKFGV